MKQKNPNNYIVPLAIMIAGLIVIAAIIYSDENSVSVDYENISASEMDISGYPVLGSDEAPIVVVEFSDYQCPFCKQFHDNVLRGILADYINNGQVKFVYKDFIVVDGFKPGSTESRDAAMGTHCANDQDKYWEYHDYVFENQKGENEGAFSPEKLNGFAEKLGLNLEQFDECFATEKYSDLIDKSIAEGRGLRIGGTPSVFINGKLVSDKIASLADYANFIEKEISAVSGK